MAHNPSEWTTAEGENDALLEENIGRVDPALTIIMRPGDVKKRKEVLGDLELVSRLPTMQGFLAGAE